MICETKLTIYGYFFVGRNSLQQPKQRLWDSITPRLRGEKFPVALARTFRAGSPPLARGKGSGKSWLDYAVGITPACAGKSFGSQFQIPIFRDHPRLRGEKLAVVAVVAAIVGSPPLARGKVPIEDENGKGEGITPACAGKRQSLSLFWRVTRDHPRLRGEKTHL